MGIDDFEKQVLAVQQQMEKALEPLKKLQHQSAPAEFPASRFPPRSLLVDPNLASEFHRHLMAWITRFEESLDQEHEVGVRLVSFGQSVTFHLEDIGFANPSLITFRGMTDQGEPVELIQHVSQISILLLNVKRKDLSQPKRPIGFTAWPEPEGSNLL